LQESLLLLIAARLMRALKRTKRQKPAVEVAMVDALQRKTAGQLVAEQPVAELATVANSFVAI
jgi:hypothetical protein